MTRRHGLLGPRAVRLIALVLALVMIAGLGAPYLLQAGVPLWMVLLLVLIVLAVPVVAVARSDRTRR
ncbi:hypothetical protein [Saccharopolyspora sp. ASAGF58]|uniref:hypothetical protein n=1 Tax=Saccharopolyspora sp. ASAGF58 TaxID=2719023 RepID=UPI0014402FE5|nr:hypothetical protein [Saccharopolyspora sp. ASAGF58]QIZ34041.1 hypothetical protein FDZ84_03935 [Saccharopolyspora sp. ASAGF58]